MLNSGVLCPIFSGRHTCVKFETSIEIVLIGKAWFFGDYFDFQIALLEQFHGIFNAHIEYELSRRHTDVRKEKRMQVACGKSELPCNVVYIQRFGEMPFDILQNLLQQLLVTIFGRNALLYPIYQTCRKKRRSILVHLTREWFPQRTIVRARLHLRAKRCSAERKHNRFWILSIGNSITV